MTAHIDQAGLLPDLLGLEWLEVGPEKVRGRFAIARHHMAPNGFLHAACLIALADTACGYGCMAALPKGAEGFTTIELKSNFLGAARDGAIACEATCAHAGRSTQVWDAVVTHDESGRTLALFRCTQIVLYPR
ncbi:MAG: PaaI family thioesterase [Phenylobacterium sp.]|uniref:PaaI family thioesterase n=1 Tax=Phenylobacterium sp. TaxID=1871053 RepID=UPI0027360518|nr:PaaI family thioesterase [Phenylobacterium sp.]MDP3174554.1 PaaI family thioesterase [Phenylobacterium sp.]